MSDTLTIIISILVPTIVMQMGVLYFVFRRMDRLEDSLIQRMDRSEARMIERMDRSEARMIERTDTAEARMIERIDKSEEGLIQRIDRSEARMTERIDKSEMSLVQRMDNSDARMTERMDRSDEEREKMRLEIRDELRENREQISNVQTGLARLEGAVEVLRGLVERFVTVPR